MAFQIFGLLFVATWIGMKIDEYMGNESYYIALLLAVVVLVIYLYKLVITLSNEN